CLRMERRDSGPADEHHESEPSKAWSKAERRDEDPGNGWREGREHPRVEAVRKIAVGRLRNRRREHQQAAEHARFRETEAQFVAQYRLECAEGARIQVDEEVADREKKESQEARTHRRCSAAVKL